jgi:hypothetical protein
VFIAVLLLLPRGILPSLRSVRDAQREHRRTRREPVVQEVAQ